jgi:nucleotide-binding universal stress UspA family protein
MISKLLIAYDGSERAKKAFDVGIEMAAKFGAEVFVVSVARPPEPADDVETEAILENANQYYEKHFADLKEAAASAGIEPHFEILVGHPAEQIVHYANVKQVDMIVMGHRGKSLIQRWLLGSVSKRVLSYANCTVTIVR